MKSMKKMWLLTIFLGIFSLCGEDVRPKNWAVPVKLDGVPNLYQVSDCLYRSAQPEEKGFLSLKKLGIKTIINLRAFHTDRKKINLTDFKTEDIHIQTPKMDEADVLKFLKLATDPSNAPLLVHCQFGADRTGAMCAIYRVVVDGWSKEDAIREMKEGGYGFHKACSYLIGFIQKLDTDKIRGMILPKGTPKLLAAAQ